jgi:hypothetical protein
MSPPPPFKCYPHNTKHQFRRATVAACESAMLRPTSKRHRNRADGFSPRDRSNSPQAEPSRKRHRSPSPTNFRASSSRHQSERQPRSSSKRPRHDKAEFFQPGAGPRGGVCAACLGRHEHAFGKCEGHKLWDGSPGSARKSEQGKLVGADGLPLCYDWQLPRGCQSALHLDRHKCSGCGKTGHGAQACPRAEKA